MYQTVFATEPGSAEMPSAGRPFTPEMITRLVARGVEIAPLLLHTGVASLEDHEPPYEEFFRVPPETADRVNAARGSGRRVVAVGTTGRRRVGFRPGGRAHRVSFLSGGARRGLIGEVDPGGRNRSNQFRQDDQRPSRISSRPDSSSASRQAWMRCGVTRNHR
jgi:hypothetical protein